MGGTSKEFRKKCNCNMKKQQQQKLKAETYFHQRIAFVWKLILIMHIDICWLVRVRGHLDKVAKEQQRIKQKKLPTFSGNSYLLKKMVLE